MPETTDRTRLVSPDWRLDTTGTFKLDLSWDDDSHRWLEVAPDGEPHCWRLVLWQASDDSSTASHEVLVQSIDDPTGLMNRIARDPWHLDHAPLIPPPAQRRA